MTAAHMTPPDAAPQVTLSWSLTTRYCFAGTAKQWQDRLPEAGIEETDPADEVEAKINAWLDGGGWEAREILADWSTRANWAYSDEIDLDTAEAMA